MDHHTQDVYLVTLHDVQVISQQQACLQWLSDTEQTLRAILDSKCEADLITGGINDRSLLEARPEYSLDRTSVVQPRYGSCVLLAHTLLHRIAFEFNV